MEENMEEWYTVLLIDAAFYYTDYVRVFSTEWANVLSLHWKLDYEIPLKDSQTKLPNGPICKPIWEEDEAFSAYLVEYTLLGKVRKSQLVSEASNLILRKKDRSLWLCVDYWELNKITTLNWYPLPLINELRKKT